jgi:hypothetical protein
VAIHRFELQAGALRHLLRACAAAALLLMAWPARAQFFSPGELAQSHAALEGDERCNDCHSAGSRVSNDKCMACHQDVGLSVRQKKGLHGRKFIAQPCGNCHSDHRGREHTLVRWNPKTFDHDETGWQLEGAHRRLDCLKCHTGKNERDQPTYIGLSNTCVSCHKDVHEGRFGTSCQNCHDDDSWKTLDLDPFDHNLARFPLRGKHQQVACAKCHGEPAKYKPLAFETCGSCHQDPHKGKLGPTCESCHVESSWKQIDMKRSAHPGLNIQAGHTKVQCRTCHDRGNLVMPSKGKECASCHAPMHEAKFGTDCADCHAQIRWLGLPDALGRRVHDKTAYPLEGKHQSTECDACHSPKLPPKKRFRQLVFARCADCHKDTHKGQFDDREAGECAPCHTLEGFAPTRFGIELHATARFALDGGHEAAPCGSCHTGTAKPRLDWQLARQACADCHENPHGTQFEKEMQAGGCKSCHNVMAWDIPNIAHETWPLTGAHQKARCDQCHTPTEADKRAGSGVSYRAAPRECEGCHDDVHLGQFRLSEPRKECQACHDTRTFKLPQFDHQGSTGYALTGKHAKVSCAACHLLTAIDGGAKTTLYRLPYDDCKDCHKDPHSEGE